MSDKGYSRRQILGAIAGVGVTGVTAGFATRAYFHDREIFTGNRFQAGALSLELAGAGVEDEDSVTDFPTESDFENGDTVSVTFPELEPGDEGVFSTAYRLCENPGRVWVRTHLIGAEETELENYLDVRFASRPDCEPRPEGEKDILFEGTLGDFHGTYSGGKLLECRYLGKIEHDEDTGEFYFDDEDEGAVTSQDPPVFEFTPDGEDSVTIELTNVKTNDDREVIEFDYEVTDGPGVCEVTTVGGGDPPGPKRKYYVYEGCRSVDYGLTPPDHDKTDGVYGLSHVEFYACGGCHGCPPGCLDLEWVFDDDPPEELLDDTLELQLEFRAIQCRHQTEPNNPWS
ncbi:hypothetical protein AArcSl_2773 [Halalkaliarchaeum desulfuricum]|uniref:SipW-cognate class signal peptide n=1 Tax=Halalkaliarchaeum desulfuricum TaxID=2055893 RepID=A0A343TMR6_9EURY|nr:hypothetical protein [Halalkaliarchaeum desulfuricum]AUX10388.1 hypothetical protein AArcSl_2773 [Halalkaliarchaeum desulfuricum]